VDESKLKKDILTYVTDLRHRLSTIRKLATENARKVLKRTKTWFDRKATAGKQFDLGDVLILIPDDEKKTICTLERTSENRKKVGDTNYDIQLSDGSVKTFHVNQLRRFKEISQFVGAVVVTAGPLVNEEDKNLNVIEDDTALQCKIELSLPFVNTKKFWGYLMNT
jgi:hypothetical protein